MPSKVAYVYDSATSSWNAFSGPPADATPTGIVSAYAGSTAPNAWLLCNGQEVSRTTYAALFAIIGTTYGAGNGTTTFKVPDLRGRVVTGVDSSQIEFDALGDTGGSKISVAPHTHAVDHDHAAVTSGNDNTDHSHSGTTGGVSANHTHQATWYETSGGANDYNNADGVNFGLESSTGVQSTQYITTGANSVGHTHAFGTGGRSAFHQHSVDVPAYTGASGSASAEATSGNLVPYMTLNYIIKT